MVPVGGSIVASPIKNFCQDIGHRLTQIQTISSAAGADSEVAVCKVAHTKFMVRKSSVSDGKVVPRPREQHTRGGRFRHAAPDLSEF